MGSEQIHYRPEETEFEKNSNSITPEQQLNSMNVVLTVYFVYILDSKKYALLFS